MTKSNFEFDAVIDKEGDFVCTGDPIVIANENRRGTEPPKSVIEETTATSTDLFMQSYLSNFCNKQNDLLAESQESLISLQREILRKIQGL